jgi:hypothetical protein
MSRYQKDLLERVFDSEVEIFFKDFRNAKNAEIRILSNSDIS